MSTELCFACLNRAVELWYSGRLSINVQLPEYLILTSVSSIRFQPSSG
ncbi:hypothetical protein [Bacillus cereus]|nr:hypothetical protein [Bacillus cereus]WNN02524.1 hypothetical protein RPB93_27505 [Bacillus cereus]